MSAQLFVMKENPETVLDVANLLTDKEDEIVTLMSKRSFV